MNRVTKALAVLALAAVPTLLAPRDASAGAAAVDEMRIDKSDHSLQLWSGGRLVKEYRVAIGSGGTGPKRMEGDNVTPVGTYRITGRIKGLFHNFLVVSYPNDDDRARFADRKRRGEVPAGHGIGNGIGVHGTGNKAWNGVHKQSDWTFGCVALDDDEIDEVAGMVRDGTRIVITD
jgi:murein L,D-transpeptidase YafK